MQRVLYFCIEDSRLRDWRLSAGFDKETNPKLWCQHALCDIPRFPFLFMLLEVPYMLILSSFVGRVPIFCLICNKGLYPRVISPRQPPSMVPEVYVLARTKFKILKIQSRDSSPADRSLSSQAIIGRGLMARDSLPLFRNQSTASLRLVCSCASCQASTDDLPMFMLKSILHGASEELGY